MVKCEECSIRKNCATMADVHWFGKDDCPYVCPYEDEEGDEHAN